MKYYSNNEVHLVYNSTIDKFLGYSKPDNNPEWVDWETKLISSKDGDEFSQVHTILNIDILYEIQRLHLLICRCESILDDIVVVPALLPCIEKDTMIANLTILDFNINFLQSYRFFELYGKIESKYVGTNLVYGD